MIGARPPGQQGRPDPVGLYVLGPPRLARPLVSSRHRSVDGACPKHASSAAAVRVHDVPEPARKSRVFASVDDATLYMELHLRKFASEDMNENSIHFVSLRVSASRPH